MSALTRIEKWSYAIGKATTGFGALITDLFVQLSGIASGSLPGTVAAAATVPQALGGSGLDWPGWRLRTARRPRKRARPHPNRRRA